MDVAVIVTVLASLGGLSGIAAIITARVNSKRGSAQSETEARAQFTAEFNAIIAAQNTQLERFDAELSRLSSEVESIRTEHRSAEDYIDVLIIGISNGTIPPIPPRL